MKMKIDSENEWGWFIEPDTFKIHKIEEDIPSGSFVNIKEKEYIEDIGRTVVQTTYGIIEGKKFQPMNKKEITKLLSEACAKYILMNDDLPPKVKIEKELKKDKAAQLAFVMNKHDTFHLKIPDNLLEGKNSHDVITEIMQNVTLDMEEKEEKWKIEYAKSSRSTCKSCGMKIEKGKVRVGEPYYYDDHLNYRWNHEKCIFWKKVGQQNTSGLDELEEEDKERIKTYFK